MTADIKRQLAAHGAKLPAPAAPAARSAPRPVDSLGAGVAGRSGAKNEPEPKPPAAACFYPGPYHVQVANGTHYPGCVRIVVTGPASEELPAALVAAITQLLNQQP